MCGICGFYSRKISINVDLFYKAHKLLKHRGPDDEGFLVQSEDEFFRCKGDDTIDYFQSEKHVLDFTEAKLIFGHRRLSIIDLSHNGHQPMGDEDGRYFITYNGELYNYIELREELELKGVKIYSKTDTEIFLKAYIAWGEKAFNKFNGMWAAAIYDTKEKRLILTRDRFGVKPLYYSLINDGIAFGSEIKFLKGLIGKLHMSEQEVLEYLTVNLIDHKKQTLFKEILELEPGHYMIFDGISIKEDVKYWSFRPFINNKLNYSDCVLRLEQLLDKSIKFRMRCDVPSGALLSGGLDSTSIVCDIKIKFKDIGTFKVFSAVFEEEEFSEKKYVEETIKETGFDVSYVNPDPRILEEELKEILYYQELPLRSLSVFTQWSLMKYIKSQSDVVVLLEGQGSDEVFGGYTEHYYSLIAQNIKELHLFKALSEAKIFSENRSKRLLDTLTIAIKKVFKKVTYLDKKLLRKFEYVKKQSEIYIRKYSASNILEENLFNDLTFSSLREYLRYEDRNSMAFSLESRLPFMDFELVEWAMNLPNKFKIDEGVNKRILRDCVKDLIPESILKRKDKMGFVSPQEVWQRTLLESYFDDLIFNQLEGQFDFLDADIIKKKYLDYKNKGNNEWALIWRICCLIEWKKLWID